MKTTTLAAAAASLFVAGGYATAQSDPSQFGTVFNIGTVPAGSIFDVPGAVTGTAVGDGDKTFENGGFLGPGNLTGDVLGSDSQLNLFGRTALIESRFAVGPSDGSGSNIEVNIFDGNVRSEFRARGGSAINMLGGSIRRDFHAESGSTISIIDGIVNDNFTALSGSTVNISGGSVRDGFDAFGDVTVSKGSVGRFMSAEAGSMIDIRGGAIGDFITFDADSTVNLFVTDATIDGTALGLSLGDTIEITQRGGALLEATLADGSFFDLQLNASTVKRQDLVDSDATVTVTLVPTPGAAAALGLGGLIAARRRRG